MIPKFSNRGKSLVIQFTVKFQSRKTADYDAGYCAAAFLKLFPPDHDPKKLNGDSPCIVRFGPDTCPTANRIQADIFYKNKIWIHNPRDYDKKIYTCKGCASYIFENIHAMLVIYFGYFTQLRLYATRRRWRSTFLYCRRTFAVYPERLAYPFISTNLSSKLHL